MPSGPSVSLSGTPACALWRTWEGIVARNTFPEVPPRVEYALTEKGEALVPLIEDMRRYGRRWLLDQEPAVEGEPARV